MSEDVVQAVRAALRKTDEEIDRATQEGVEDHIVNAMRVGASTLAENLVQQGVMPDAVLDE